MSGKRMETAAPAPQKRRHHHRRRRTRIWPLAAGIVVLAALVIGVWSLIAGYFILSPQPVLTLNGDKHEEVSACSDYTDPGARAHRGRTDLSGDVEEQSDLDIRRPGDYTITYTVTYRGRTAHATRTVTVRDTTAPVIELRGDAHSYAYLGTDWKDAGVTATDDVDGDVTSAVTASGTVDTSTAGDYTITYTVTDQAGNTATAERTVTVKKTDKSSRIYLTFDDGPSQRVTPRILDTLKQYGAKATFFIINYSDGDKPLIQRMIDEGHTIAIHGYSHDYATIYASDDAFMENIYKLRDRLREDFGYEATFIRFPGGASNTISANHCKGIMSRLVKRVEQEGFAYFDWNVDSGDADGNTKPKDYILSHVKGGLCQGRGNVVLMHDTGVKTTTADALPEILQYGLANGYTFLPITKDTVPVHHATSN